MLKIPEQAHKAGLWEDSLQIPTSQSSSVSPASLPCRCHCSIRPTPLPWGKKVPDCLGALAALRSDPGMSHWSCLLPLLFFCSRAQSQKVILRKARNQCLQTGRSRLLVEKCYLENFFSFSIYPSSKGQTPPPHTHTQPVCHSCPVVSPPLCLSLEGGDLPPKCLLHPFKTASPPRRDMSSISRNQL